MAIVNGLFNLLKLNSDDHGGSSAPSHTHHFPQTEGFELAEYILGENVVETFYAVKPAEADEIVAKLLRFQKAMDASADDMKNYYETHKENDQWLHDLDATLQKIDQGLLPDHTYDHDTAIVDAAATVNLALTGVDHPATNPHLELDQQTTTWTQNYGLSAEQLARLIYFRHDHELTQQDVAAVFAGLSNSGGDLRAKYDFAINKMQEQIQIADHISDLYLLTPHKSSQVRTVLLNSPDMTEQHIKSLIESHPSQWNSVVEVLSGLIELPFSIENKLTIAKLVTANQSWTANFILQNFHGAEFVSAINQFTKVVSDLSLSEEDYGKLGTFLKNNPRSNEAEMKLYIQTFHQEESASGTANVAANTVASAAASTSTPVTASTSLTVVENLAQKFHLTSTDQELLEHWMVVNPRMTESELHAMFSENPQQTLLSIRRLDQAKEISGQYHLSAADTLSVARILAGDLEMTKDYLVQLFTSNPSGYHEVLLRLDTAVAVKEKYRLTKEELNVLKIVMTSFAELDSVYILNLIANRPNDWKSLLKDFIGDAQNQAQQSDFTGISGFAPRTGPQHSISLINYFHSVNPRILPEGIPASWTLSDLESYCRLVNCEELIRNYISFHGSPLEKKYGVLSDLDKHFPNLSAEPSANGDSRNPKLTYDNENFNLRHRNFHDKYGDVSYRDVDADLVKYMDPVTHLARQINDQGKKFEIMWQNPGGDYAKYLAIYLDMIGVKDVDQLYVLNGRIVDRSNGRDLGQYDENEVFAFSGAGTGWTNIKMIKHANGQLILYPSWGPTSDAKYAGAVAGLLLAWTGAGAAIGAAFGATGATATAIGVTIGSSYASVVSGNSINLRTIATTFISSFTAASVSEFLNGSTTFTNSVGGAGSVPADIIIGGISNASAAVVTGGNIGRSALMGAIQAGMGHFTTEVVELLNLNFNPAQSASLASFLSSATVSRLFGEKDWALIVTQGLTAAANSYNQALRKSQNVRLALVSGREEHRLLEVNIDGTEKVIVIQYEDGSRLVIHENYFDPNSRQSGTYVVAIDSDGLIANGRFEASLVTSGTETGIENDFEFNPDSDFEFDLSQVKLELKTYFDENGNEKKYLKFINDSGETKLFEVLEMSDNGQVFIRDPENQNIIEIAQNEDGSFQIGDSKLAVTYNDETGEALAKVSIGSINFLATSDLNGLKTFIHVDTEGVVTTIKYNENAVELNPDSAKFGIVNAIKTVKGPDGVESIIEGTIRIISAENEASASENLGAFIPNEPTSAESAEGRDVLLNSTTGSSGVEEKNEAVTGGFSVNLLDGMGSNLLGEKYVAPVSAAYGERLDGIVVGNPLGGGPNNPYSQQLARFISDLANSEGLSINYVSPTDAGLLSDSTNVNYISGPSSWPQDGAFTRTADGSVSYVPQISENENRLHSSELNRRRLADMVELGVSEADARRFISAVLPMGSQFSSPDQVGANLIATAPEGARVTEMRSFNEGGNTLLIPSSEGSVSTALVGRDSVSYTAIRHGISDTDAVDMIARDLGVPADKVVVVPQSEFHIDMFVRPMPNGVILVNDPSMANQIAEQYVRGLAVSENWSAARLNLTLTKLSQIDNSGVTAATKAQADATAAKLESNGFTVLRVAGAFSIPNAVNNSVAHYNLLNMLEGISPKDGAQIGVVGGAPGLLQSNMAQIYFENGLERVHFTSPELADALLMGGKGGGINCLTKIIGHSDELNLISSGTTVKLGG